MLDLVTCKSIRKVGIAGRSLITVDLLTAFQATLAGAEWLDVEKDVSMLRAVKSPAEVAVIRHAYQIAQIGMQAAIDAVKVGITEREVAAEAEAAMRRAGAEGTGIDTIVASGPHARPILARSTFREIESGDLDRSDRRSAL